MRTRVKILPNYITLMTFKPRDLIDVNNRTLITKSDTIKEKLKFSDRRKMAKNEILYILVTIAMY